MVAEPVDEELFCRTAVVIFRRFRTKVFLTLRRCLRRVRCCVTLYYIVTTSIVFGIRTSNLRLKYYTIAPKSAEILE